MDNKGTAAGGQEEFIELILFEHYVKYEMFPYNISYVVFGFC